MSSNEIQKIEAIFQKAEQLRESKQNDKALQEYSKVVHFAPRHWPSYFHLGVLLGEAGHNELAISLLHRADSIKPKDRVIKNHIADFLIKLNRNDEAIEYLKESWSLNSKAENISALLKIGKILWETNRPSEAIECFNQILSIKSEAYKTKENKEIRTIARWWRALSKMTLGDYQAAWSDYEIRNNLEGVIVTRPSGKLWKGEPLKGKKIFLAYEQRFGDVLQFIRFVNKLQAMEATVICQLPKELLRLIGEAFPDVKLVSTKDPIPEYDYYQYLTSIPAVLNYTKKECTSDKKPYLKINQKTKHNPLPMRGESFLKVGLVWQGKPEPDRSVPLKLYIPFLRHKSVSFYSFQLGEKRQDLFDNAVSWLVHDLSSQINDFHDSSVLLEEMDLLITIDTAIAHQAGALGIPVWIVLRFFADWRWEIDREDNPWYQSMRIFRQHKIDDWSKVSIQLEQAFDEWVSSSSQELAKTA